jgi:hypothetical protein
MISGIMACIYIMIPIIAGYSSWGPDKRGICIYPVDLHIFLYSIGYNSKYEEKPRIDALANPVRPWLYEIKIGVEKLP